MTSPPSRRVWLFGTLRAETNGQSVEFNHQAARLLFAYLLLHPHVSHPREALADTLWPDAPVHRVRRMLSDALYRLRRTLGSGWLIADNSHIALYDEADLWADIWEFMRCAQSSDPAEQSAAIALYQGDLLPEIYADWSTAPRIAFREQYLAVLARLGKQAEAAGDLVLAGDYYQRLCNADPLHEDAHHGLMRALARSNRLPEALATYARFEQLLATELGIGPGLAIRELVTQLQAELELPHWPGSDVPQAFLRPEFVGRIAERAMLLERLEQAQQGRGGIIGIVGPAGIGKSRLLDELGAAASWRGWQIAYGRADEQSLPAPYSPLRQALPAILPPVRLQQIGRLLAAHRLALLARLFPGMAWPASSATEPGAVAIEQVADALLALLDGLGAIAPTLILLDDLQWADVALWPLLETLYPALQNRRLLLVLAMRDDEIARHSTARAALAVWERQGTAPLRLAGLAAADLKALAQACGIAELAPADHEQLQVASGGNPLFALSLLQTGLTAGPLPQSLAELALRRVEPLDAVARKALEAAVVAGYRFTYPAWEAIAAAAGLEVTRLPALAGEIERHGLLILETDHYRFSHDTLRTAVYENWPPEQRRAWHTCALTALAGMPGYDALLLLVHAEGAQQADAVGRYALEAGEQALAAFGYRSAEQLFQQALETIAPANIGERYRATLGLAQTLNVLAEREAQGRAIVQLQQLAHALGDEQRRMEAAWHQVNLAWATGEFARARDLAVAVLPVAERLADLRLLALLLEYAGRAARDLSDYVQAHDWFSQAADCYRRLDDPAGIAWIDGMRGLIAQRQGRYQEAIAYHRNAMAAHHDCGNPFNEMRAASGLAIALWLSGDYLQAQSIFEHTLQLSRNVGDRRIEEASLANLGALADILADYETAVQLKQAALDLSRTAANQMGIALGLSNLGITYTKLARLEAAVQAFDEALAIDQAIGRRHGEAHALHGRGVAQRDLGHLSEARADLLQARAIRQDLAERDMLVATEADLALLELAAGDAAALARAGAHMQAMLETLVPADRADLRAHVYYSAYAVLQQRGEQAAAQNYLGMAILAMQEMAAALPPAAHQRLLQNDPLLCKISAARHQTVRIVTTRLARADTPLGRRLEPGDYIEIQWTLTAPEDLTLAAADARRHQVLQRLLQEAVDQGAAPTDSDLARILGVSRRTILRDMARLPHQQDPRPTRRRRRMSQ